MIVIPPESVAYLKDAQIHLEEIVNYRRYANYKTETYTEMRKSKTNMIHSRDHNSSTNESGDTGMVEVLGKEFSF